MFWSWYMPLEITFCVEEQGMSTTKEVNLDTAVKTRMLLKILAKCDEAASKTRAHQRRTQCLGQSNQNRGPASSSNLTSLLSDPTVLSPLTSTQKPRPEY
ncbi:hypothetical protein NP233_g11382 [Leucocoprinus birnbaumii]|uniref:Uncharacterized protein n=1 Tax=Leucocoprinus birnbaumii TaxID=56174 RepID=A0AAD5YKH0_9AGAR|nr:hypothetical protein NP233_g11382 [Leucocoprinus birnbaumii]